MEENLIKTGACPACRKRIRLSPNVPRYEHPPLPGDLTVCPSCATFLAFKEGGALRLLRPGEFERLDGADQRTLQDTLRLLRELSECQ